MRKSIVEICSPDHDGDPELIRNWTANKTTENVAKWINNSTMYCVTALDKDEQVVGFSMMRQDGEILLLYVSPDAVGSGSGRAMLESLESFAKSTEISELHLLSSKTAHGFYTRHGFSENGQPEKFLDGLPGYPMRKRINVDGPRSG